MKLLHDEFKVKVIATGSSELKQKGKEFDSQAGRFTEHYCLPLSIFEIKANSPLPAYEEKAFEKDFLKRSRYLCSYPRCTHRGHIPMMRKSNFLKNITDTYVLKDIVDIYELKNQKLAKDILTKIALQLGSEVSIREIASSLGSNGITVANYIEIFIKNYILIALPSFKTNAETGGVGKQEALFFMIWASGMPW